jgi:hypothetical protein
VYSNIFKNLVEGHEVTVPHLAEVALRQGVWGKWYNILKVGDGHFVTLHQIFKYI